MSMRSGTLRVGLLTATLIFFYVGLSIWNIGQTSIALLNFGLSMIAWLSGMSTAALALLPSVSHRAAWLVLASFIALASQNAYLSSQYYSPLTAVHTDNEMIGKYALEALKRGQD